MKLYTREEVQLWRDDIAESAAKLAERYPDTNRFLIEDIRGLARSTPINTWKEAVLDACVIANIGWDENNPYKTVNDLIQWHIDIALDTSVSSAAQELFLRGVSSALAENPRIDYGVH